MEWEQFVCLSISSLRFNAMSMLFQFYKPDCYPNCVTNFPSLYIPTLLNMTLHNNGDMIS